MNRRLVAGTAWAVLVSGASSAQSPVLVMGCETTDLIEEECPQMGQHLGADLAKGDFNGDGITDLALGGFSHATPGDSSLTRAVVFLGREVVPGRVFFDEPHLVIEGNGMSDQFGLALAFVPDVDGDGTDELVVGAPNWPNAWDGSEYVRVGKVDFFFGTSIDNGAVSCPTTGPIVWDAETCADFTWTGTLQGQRFGAALAATERFDADLLPDFAIGAPGSDDVPVAYAGEVHVITGPSLIGMVDPPGPPPEGCDQVAYPARITANFGTIVIDAPPPVPPAATNDHDRFGRSLAFAGDLFGTRPSELLVGAPQFRPLVGFNAEVVAGSCTGSGYAQLYSYAPGHAAAVNGVAPILDQRLPGSGVGQFDAVNGIGEGYGLSVGGSVDVDDDDEVDVYVGAPLYVDATSGPRTGRVLAYSGATLATLRAPGSPSPDTARVFERVGEIACGQFGSSVGPLGDLHGDDRDEILVGAWLARWCTDSYDPCSNEQPCPEFPCVTTPNPTGDDDGQGGIQSGAAYVVGAGSGGTGELLVRIIGEDGRDHMGFEVLGGALDASGAVDVVAAGMAWAADGGPSETGRVYVFAGEFLQGLLP